jgi:non-heme chloroperoxidase
MTHLGRYTGLHKRHDRSEQDAASDFSTEGVRIMINVPDVVAGYMAVWNENNSETRRKRIEALWSPDGATCNRLIEARGYEEIEARVIGSWSKWLSEGKYVFRPRGVAQHHSVIKFDWVMTKVPGGEVDASGVSFLMLNPDGRIAYDYQFNPTASDAENLAERYVAMWNERDSEARRGQIAALFARQGAYLNEAGTAKGHDAIAAEADAAQHAYAAKGFKFSPSGFSQAHHNVARFEWRVQAESGGVAAVGSDFVILDENGRILFDYQFEEAASSAPAAKKTRGFVETRDGTRIYWVEHGQGRPLLFINSWAMTTRMWDYQIAVFADQGFRCIAYDRRGHGRSDEPAEGYDYDTFADDLAAVIEALDLKGVTLIGHSMAGGEIVRYLARHGEARIAGAVLLAPTTPFLLKSEDNPNGLARENFEAVRNEWKRDFPKWVADNTAPFFTPETSQALMKWAIDIMLGVSLPVAIAVNRTVTEADFRAEMKNIAIPMLILHGDKDVSAPVETTGQASAALLPKCELKVYEGAPHGLMYTHMERVHADILSFIRHLGES